MRHSIPVPFILASAAVILSLAVPLPVHAQMSDLIQQRLMQGGGTGTPQQSTVDVPGMGGSTVTRPSDLLPVESAQTYAPQSEILLDQTIDPESYIVGPGDLLAVYLWGDIDRSYSSRVTPEGLLIIPTVGPVAVGGLSIMEAREAIRATVSRNYTDLDISAYLVEPRRFRLSVSGIVYFPGMMESHAMERVSDVLDRAGIILPGEEWIPDARDEATQVTATPMETAQPNELTSEDLESMFTKRPGTIGRPDPLQMGRTLAGTTGRVTGTEELYTLGEKRGSSIRRVVVHRPDGEVEADLLRFIKLGDLDANPYVSAGDHVEVLPYNGDISVIGEVNDQGYYEFMEGDRISDLVGFGGGLTSVADTSAVTLVRFAEDGRNYDNIPINLYDAVWGYPDDPRYLLREADRLYVRRKYEYKMNYSVTISGEVRYPGQYPIEKSGTTLTDLVDMAGGFTGDENLDETRLIRQGGYTGRDLEYQRIRQLDPALRSTEENDYMRASERLYAGSITVDFSRLFRDGDRSFDVVLQDGDMVHVPITAPYVRVIGAVEEPGYIPFQDGADFEDYIDMAGGYNWNADRSERMLYKARTGQKYRPRNQNVVVEAGDTIHVPERPMRTFRQYFAEISGYVTSIATLVLIGMQINSK